MKLGFAILASLLMVGAVVVIQSRKQWPKAGDDMAIRQEQRFGYDRMVRGRVMLANGKPATGLLIRARFEPPQPAAPGEGFACTDENGSFEIHGLAPRAFVIYLGPKGARLSPETRTVDLTSTKVIEGIDFTVTFDLMSI